VTVCLLDDDVVEQIFRHRSMPTSLLRHTPPVLTKSWCRRH
jgi:hypothetical protein